VLQANRPNASIFSDARIRRAGLLAASLGVNLPAFWLLAAAFQSHPADAALTIIPVTLVEDVLTEPPLPAEPPPEPPVDPAPPPPAPIVKPPPPAPADPAPLPPEPSAEAITSPVIAAPGETVDAQLPSPAPTGPPPAPALAETSLPQITGERAQAATALRGLACHRLGSDRPDWCDDETGHPGPALPVSSLADEPEMQAHAWKPFEIVLPDLELERLKAERCPPSGGVIKNVFQPSSSPYRQGIAGAGGTLSQGSTDLFCD